MCQPTLRVPRRAVIALHRTPRERGRDPPHLVNRTNAQAHQGGSARAAAPRTALGARPHLPRHPTTRELTEWPSLINPHSSRQQTAHHQWSAAVGVDQAGPLGELARRGVPREVRPRRRHHQEYGVHGFVVHYLWGDNALDLRQPSLQPGSDASAAGLVLTWADVVVASIGLIALVGCLALLLVGRDIPVWLATLPGSVLGYYAGAVRKA